jgi:alpha-N-arabinofuranosidase
MMRNIPLNMMWGLSLHHYMTNWRNHGSATDFTEEDYFETMERAVDFSGLLDRHIAIMDQFDPRNRVALVVDEWGTWWDVEPGTNPGFLYQQNTMRDAFLAAISLHHFNERCRRIKMANIAQTVNVLQAMILTEEEKMILTPTYHVFEMYKVHQDATLLPMKLETDDYVLGEQNLPAVHASASRDEEGSIHLSLVNIDTGKDAQLTVEIRGMEFSGVSGRILTSSEVNAHNTFDDPLRVRPGTFTDLDIRRNKITVQLPAKSVVVLEIK